MALKRRYPNPTDSDEIRLIAKCKELGVYAHCIGDLSMHSDEYPINDFVARYLAEEFKTLADPHLRLNVLIAISRPEYREVAMPLVVQTLRKDGGGHYGQMAANDLGRIATKDDVPTIENLLLDTNVGVSRSLIVPTYAKLAKKQGIATLRKLVYDPDTQSQALKHLSILGDTSIEPELQQLAKHPDSYHRAVARDALRRLAKKAVVKWKESS